MKHLFNAEDISRHISETNPEDVQFLLDALSVESPFPQLVEESKIAHSMLRDLMNEITAKKP